MAALPFVAVADYDGFAVFTCASVDVMVCLPVEGCNRASADAVELPRFYTVDIKNKQVTTAHADDTRKSAIQRVEEVEGKLMLQGAEEGREGVRDGLGWTMSVNTDRDDMVLAVSGEGVAFVVFGAMIVQRHRGQGTASPVAVAVLSSIGLFLNWKGRSRPVSIGPSRL